jgi:hypothetical protein
MPKCSGFDCKDYSLATASASVDCERTVGLGITLRNSRQSNPVS